ncbi:hypothetical protein BGZ99_000794 [Dissophora globulifera]|uniref:Uncharacterized protein n=1 Tax=Dissophora globulifera TaxID=979702 RepID=A0A9P6R2N3_9FUNG|nr:hypothetical protein BGZ99_000794 [Dissophora globulifera]
MEHKKVLSQYQREEGYNIQLNKELEKISEENRLMLKNHERLEHKNTELLQQYNDLQHKYNKKVENYKELDRNYMALVRPLQVTKDDPSTIYNRLVQITVSIEHLIQRAKGDRSVNLRREAVFENFQGYGLFQVFPEEALLDPYHLNLYMESVIMTILFYRLFARPLGCIFEQSKEFEGIRKWVNERDPKMATRWRQQICVLVAQDVDTMAHKREEEVRAAAESLSHVISTIYPNVDMSVKIKELCYNTFDLSLAMFGMESMIYPVPIRLGIPFDNENMTTPQKSNPEGLVSLVIFPAFQDDSKNFYYKPKVWCY